MHIKITNPEEKLIPVSKEHEWTFYHLGNMKNHFGDDYVFDMQDFITEDDVMDALNSPNGKTKTFPGLYVQDFLGATIFRLLIDTGEGEKIEYDMVDHRNTKFHIKCEGEDYTLQVIYDKHKVVITPNNSISKKNKSNVSGEDNTYKEHSEHNRLLKYTKLLKSNFSSKILCPMSREITFSCFYDRLYPIDKRVWNIMQLCGTESLIFEYIIRSINNYINYTWDNDALFLEKVDSEVTSFKNPDDLFYEIANYKPYNDRYHDGSEKFKSIRQKEFDEGDYDRNVFRVRSVQGLLMKEFIGEQFTHTIYIEENKCDIVKKYTLKNKYCSIIIVYPQEYNIIDDSDIKYDIEDNSSNTEHNTEHNSNTEHDIKCKSSSVINNELIIGCFLIDNVLTISMNHTTGLSMRSLTCINDVNEMMDESTKTIFKTYTFPIPFPNSSSYQVVQYVDNFSIPYMTERTLHLLCNSKLIPFKFYTLTNMIRKLDGQKLLEYCRYNKFPLSSYKEKVDSLLKLLRTMKVEVMKEYRDYMIGSTRPRFPEYFQKFIKTININK